jgi:hypothetical protein
VPDRNVIPCRFEMTLPTAFAAVVLSNGLASDRATALICGGKSTLRGERRGMAPSLSSTSSMGSAPRTGQSWSLVDQPSVGKSTAHSAIAGCRPPLAHVDHGRRYLPNAQRADEAKYCKKAEGRKTLRASALRLLHAKPNERSAPPIP